MPTVHFTIKDVNENPLPATTFTISAGYPDTGYVPGDPVPVPVNATTDALGRFTLELVSTTAPYYITLASTESSSAFTAYKFFVPETSASELQADVLYVDLGNHLKLLNDASVLALIEAKVSVANQMALYGPSLLSYLESMDETLRTGASQVLEHTVADGDIAVADDAQAKRRVYKGITTNNTPTRLTRDDGTQVVPVPAHGVMTYSILVSGGNTTTPEGAGYQITGCIMRGASVDSTALIGTPTVIVLGESDSSWDASVDYDATLGGLKILVTGATGKTIHWVALVDTSVVKCQ